MATNPYGSYLAGLGSGTATVTHTTYAYGSNNYSAPTATSAPATTNFTANNPYAGQATGGTYTAQTVTAPSFAGSNYQPGTVQYDPQQVDNRYASYLQNEYAGGGALPTNQQGQTAYDIQRSAVQSDTEAARSARTEALQRQLAAMGLSDSGIALKQNRMMQADLERAAGRQLSDINTEELQARERKAERLGSQAFQAEQGQLGREVQRELTYAGLSLEEQKIFENARQFDTKVEFDSWATTQGYNQQERERVWQTLENQRDRALKGELTYADLNQRDRELAQQATQFGDKMEFDAWAKSMDLDAQRADRIWQTVENEKGREHDIAMIAERLIAQLSTMDYQDVLAARAEDRKTTAEYYHALGEAGGMEAAEVEALKASNPTAYMAYKAGEAGKTVADVERDLELQDKYVNAFITSFDPTSFMFQDAITKFFTELGVDIPEGMAAGAGDTSSVYQIAQKGDLNQFDFKELVGGDKPEASNHRLYVQLYEKAPVFVPKPGEGAKGYMPPQGYFKYNNVLYFKDGENNVVDVKTGLPVKSIE